MERGIRLEWCTAPKPDEMARRRLETQLTWADAYGILIGAREMMNTVVLAPFRWQTNDTVTPLSWPCRSVLVLNR